MDISSVFDKVAPLSARPTKATTKGRSKFRTEWGKVLTLLHREMRQVGARMGTRVLEMDLESSKIRNDGFPRSDAKPASSHVAVRFSTHGGKDFFLDAGKYWDWQDNVYAIALSLEALRTVDRYGVANGRQYAGFLPPGSGVTMNARPALTLEQAASMLANLAFPELVTNLRMSMAARMDNAGEHYMTAKREAARRTHPDKGGKPEDWELFQESIRVLEAHHAHG